MTAVPWGSQQWGWGLTPTQHPVFPLAHCGATLGARMGSRGVSGLGAPSPEGVPELDGNGTHLFGFTAAFHRRPSLAAERAAGPEGKDGEELRERSSASGGKGKGGSLRPWGPPPPWGGIHPSGGLHPPVLSHGGRGGAGRAAIPQLLALCASTGAAAGTGTCVRG